MATASSPQQHPGLLQAVGDNSDTAASALAYLFLLHIVLDEIREALTLVMPIEHVLGLLRFCRLALAAAYMIGELSRTTFTSQFINHLS